MSEEQILSKAKQVLTRDGGTAWSGARWSDIFGIFDILYWNPDEAPSPAYIQVSTKDHRWARITKIEKWAAQHGGLPSPSFLMLWDHAAGEFEVQKLS